MRLIYLFAAFLMLPLSAYAQLAGADTTPGSSCAGFPTGATRVTADADDTGVQVTLICNGSTWEQEGLVAISKTGDPPTADGGGGSSLWQEGGGGNIHYSSGLVGIGTSSPLDTFHVSGGMFIEGFNSQLAFYDPDGGSNPVTRFVYEDTSDGAAIVLRDALGDSPMVRFYGESGGSIIQMGDTLAPPRISIARQHPDFTASELANLTINTTGQYVGSGGREVAALEIDGEAADTNNTLIRIDSNDNQDDLFALVMTGNNGANSIMSVTSSGLIGIGDSTPDVALDVVGDINYTGVIVDVSDIRMKYDIHPMENSLEKLTTLNGFSFKMKDGDGAITEYGVSAQDVQKVFPELVHEVDADGTLGVSYDGLIAPMIEAMKEQQAQIEALQAEIEILKSASGLPQENSDINKLDEL